jgi:CRISPR system Cascade subunit CasA
MSSYDLRYEPWIPWRRRDGTTQWGAPSVLLDDVLGPNPVVGVNTTRPDFDAALLEFLIGLLAVTLQPRDVEEWLALYESPPSADALRARLQALPDAFDLTAATGPRFLQDLAEADFASQDVVPIERLLIDTPGEQTIKQHKAHFVRQDRFGLLGCPAAALALLTLQSYSPAGGAGHRTSMRGGGPLTTLADPRDGNGANDQLWRLLWMNVPTHEDLRAELLPIAGGTADVVDERVFPWLSATKESTKGRPPVTPADGHPWQSFFGMPRRIRLEVGGAGVCAFTGQITERTIVGYRTRPYGVNYEGWMHPLSPHYQAKPGSPWLPVHAQPGGICWRDWPSLALYEPTSGRCAALTMMWARDRSRHLHKAELRLMAFGYDMDNMKARGWITTMQPWYALDDEPARLLGATVRSIVEGANMIASELARQIKHAEFGDDKSATGDWSWVREALFDATETAFHERLAVCALAGATADAREELARGMATPLREAALAIFDYRCPLAGASVKSLQHGVVAREQLRTMLRGYSPLGEKMFGMLGLTPPGGGRAQRRQRKTLNKVAP